MCCFSFFSKTRLVMLWLVVLVASVSAQSTLYYGKMRIAVACSGQDEFVFVADRQNETARPSLMLNILFAPTVTPPTRMDMGDGLGWIVGHNPLGRPNSFVVQQWSFESPPSKRTITPETRSILGIPTVTGVRSLLVVMVSLPGLPSECSLDTARNLF